MKTSPGYDHGFLSVCTSILGLHILVKRVWNELATYVSKNNVSTSHDDNGGWMGGILRGAYLRVT